MIISNSSSPSLHPAKGDATPSEGKRRRSLSAVVADSFPSSAEDPSERRVELSLRLLLQRQRYADLLELLDNFSRENKLQWLNRWSGLHVPLLFEKAILLLEGGIDELKGSEVREEAAHLFLLAEMRIREDLAVFGYSREEGEFITEKFLEKELCAAMSRILEATGVSITLYTLWSELETLSLRIAISEEVVQKRRPLPVDWKNYAESNGAVSEKREHLALRQKSCRAFLKHRRELSSKRGERDGLSPISNFISGKVLDLERTNLLELLLYGHCYRYQPPPLPEGNRIDWSCSSVNLLLLQLWNISDGGRKLSWLRSNSASGHPLFPFEYALSLFENEPTFVSYKAADEWIGAGLSLLEMECECAKEASLQSLCRYIEEYYRKILINSCIVLSSDCERAKIDLWNRSDAEPKVRRRRKKFIELFSGIKLPPPVWLFMHSKHYEREKEYSYDRDTEFAFASWRWPRLRRGYINRMRALL